MTNAWLTLSQQNNKRLFYISLVGISLLVFGSYWISYLATATATPVAYIGDLTIAQYTLIGLLMLLAWKTAPDSSHLHHYRLLIIVAVVLRIGLFAVEPYTSNDVDRYLFDGRIAVEGFDPYRLSHDAEVLKDLRAQWQPPAEHAKYVTLYPPLALGLFSVAASAGVTNAIVVWKGILLVAGLLTLWLSTRVLQHANKLKHLPLIALSPLLILETGIGLHIDAVSTLAIIAAVYYWQRHRLLNVGIVIGLGVSIKLLPIMLLLPFVMSKTKFIDAVKLVSAAVLTVIVIYSVTVISGLYPVGSISVFFEKWRFGAPLFVLLDGVLSGKNIVGLLLIIAVVTSGLIAYFCWHYRSIMSLKSSLLIGAAQLAVALPLIISPVVFPWYLMPLVPLLALYPNRYLLAWTLVVPLGYEVLNQYWCCGHWLPAQWPILIIGLVQVSALLALLQFCYKNWPKLSLNRLSSTDKL